MKEKRGTTLLVLCILSFISTGYSFFENVGSIIGGPLTEAEMTEAKLGILSSAKAEEMKDFVFILDESIEMLEIQQANHYLIGGVTLVASLLGFVGVLLMFNLKKNGYYLYLAYCLIPLILMSMTFGSLTLGILMMVFVVVIDLVFIILYSYQLKRME